VCDTVTTCTINRDFFYVLQLKTPSPIQTTRALVCFSDILRLLYNSASASIFISGLLTVENRPTPVQCRWQYSTRAVFRFCKTRPASLRSRRILRVVRPRLRLGSDQNQAQVVSLSYKRIYLSAGSSGALLYVCTTIGHREN
jgi:hypothetical protein